MSEGSVATLGVKEPWARYVLAVQKNCWLQEFHFRAFFFSPTTAPAMNATAPPLVAEMTLATDPAEMGIGEITKPASVASQICAVGNCMADLPFLHF